MEIIGQKVLHKTLGYGEIISYGGKQQNNKKYISVIFNNKEVEFPFPDTFDKYLKAVDVKFSEFISNEISKLHRCIPNDTPVYNPPVNPKPIRNNRTPRTELSFGNICGTNSRTFYLECCSDFGWEKNQSDKFGTFGALLYAKGATPEGYSPWFLSHHDLTQTTGGSWSNIIEEDVIYEKWHVFKPGLFDDKTSRVVFIKLEKQYYFYGVFCVDSIEKDKDYKYIKKYKRISKKYPIESDV